MSRRVNWKTAGFLAGVLAAILVLGGVLGACSRTQTTTTSAPAQTTTTSAPVRTTTSAAAPAGVSAADFYKANVVTLIVPYSPGGGADFAARLFANYWTETTGGRMIVDNKSGAGGVVGANYVYAAKPDGLTLGVGLQDSGLIAPVLNKDPAVRYDLKKMIFIEFTNRAQPDGFGVGIKAPYNSFSDVLKSKGFKFGASGPASGGALGGAFLIEATGLQDARITVGYGSSAEVALAVAKGELDGQLAGDTTLRDAVDKGFMKKPFLTVNSERNPNLPDVPALTELMKLSAEQQNLFGTLTALRGGQVFWYQPGVPQDRVEFVRSAFDKMVVNENLVKQAKTMWPIWVQPVAGKDYAAEMDKMLAVATPERFAELAKLVAKYVR